MTDEKYLYTQDVRDKRITARSARSKRTHNGKGGSVKLPSDYMTQKELKAMNGPVESFPLNSPMDWKKFKSMPDDLKVLYIKSIRSKYNAPDRYIANMLGVGVSVMAREVNRLGIALGKTRCGRIKWDKEAFLAWANGVSVRSVEPVAESEVQPEAEILVDYHPCEPAYVQNGETSPKETVIPCCGSLNFNGAADAALNMVADLLGGANVRISITWELCDNG